MHWIQKHILLILSTTPTARFSQLRPMGVESNLFMFHLNKLLKEDLIVKSDGTYSLSSKGKLLVERDTLDSSDIHSEPRAFLLLAIQNQHSEYLLYRRAVYPALNKIGFPLCEISNTHSLEKISRDGIKKLCGKSAPVQFRGTARTRLVAQKSLISHTITLLFSTKLQSPSTPKSSKVGTYFWAKPEDLPRDELIRGFWEVYQAMQTSPRPFFLDTQKGEKGHDTVKVQ